MPNLNLNQLDLEHGLFSLFVSHLAPASYCLVQKKLPGDPVLLSEIT